MPLNHLLVKDDVDFRFADSEPGVAVVDEFFLPWLLELRPKHPCIKDIIGGLRYEIVENFPHLAVYRLDPTLFTDVPATAYDQFGVWQFSGLEAIWLVVPSDKHTVVGTESKNWGSIKSLYR